MTSDAKIGLLLGLIFIFLIAFIINGLPNFRDDKNSNELTTSMVSSQNDSLGLAARQRKVSRELINQIEPAGTDQPKTQSIPADKEDTRFAMQLPKSLPAVKENAVKSTGGEQILPVAEKKQSTRFKKARPKSYVVCSGDSLAVIAKKLYGSENGNIIANIDRIFQANRRVLKSPDEVYPGQRLIIPPLPVSSKPGKNKIANVFSTAGFAKVKSIGQRHFVYGKEPTKQSRQYVVRQGDSLWQIADEQLGDGSRYSEIARLNADILDNEDRLVVGMCLKLPGRAGSEY